MGVLATHTGSLPRSQAVVDLLFARERGEPTDEAEFARVMREAVHETVRRQVEAGIDVVSDGETAKISYATYVKDRYSGFVGDSPRNAPADLAMFPSFLERLAREGGTPSYARPMCVGEVRPTGQHELERDITNLREAMERHGARRGCRRRCSAAGTTRSAPRVATRRWPGRMAGARLEVVEAAGHLPTLEAPEPATRARRVWPAAPGGTGA